MGQMMTATLALLVMTLIAINQSRSEHFARARLVDDEVETMASGVALGVLEHIASRDFDQATRTSTAPVVSTTALTSPFPTNLRCDVTYPIQTASPYTACPDVEDFNGMQWETIAFPVRGDTLWFEASAEVTYVDANQQPTTSKTFAKQITVLVRDKVSGGVTAPRLLRLPVRLPRVVSYPK